MSDASNTPASQPAPTPISQEPPKTVEEIVKQIAPEKLDELPDELKKGIVVVQETREIHQFRSAPLPEASELAAYNATIPNGADRIMIMTEKQSAHRIRIEKIAVVCQQIQGFVGQFFALLVALSFGGYATYAAVHGQPWFGSVIGGTTLVGLVTTFLATRAMQKSELREKRGQMTPPEAPQLPPPPPKNKKKRR